MSNFIQLEQSLGRRDPDAARGDVDLDADIGSQRHQYFTARAVDHQPAAAAAAVHPYDAPHRGAVRRFHFAPHQLMLVVAPRLERL